MELTLLPQPGIVHHVGVIDCVPPRRGCQDVNMQHGTLTCLLLYLVQSATIDETADAWAAAAGQCDLQEPARQRHAPCLGPAGMLRGASLWRDERRNDTSLQLWKSDTTETFVLNDCLHSQHRATL